MRRVQKGGSGPLRPEERSPGAGGLFRRRRPPAGAVAASEVPPVVREVLRSPGQPLDAGARAFMEPRFGHDFSRVRIHADARAADSARAVDALAYTVGQDVVFGAGLYQPGAREGRRLLAHELAHTLQQGEVGSAAGLTVAEPDHPGEAEANRVADAVAAGARASAPSSLAGGILQRQPKTGASASASAAPSASPPTPTQIYQQALPKVKTLDPAIFALLSKAGLGAGPQLVLSEQTQGPPGTLPIIIEVRLEVALGTLPSNKDAEINSATRKVPDPAANKFELKGTMTVNSAMTPGTTPDALAQVLVHEGTHFQISMDKLVISPQNQSAHAGPFGKYVQTAKSLSSALMAQLDLYMEKVLTQRKVPTDSGARFKDARKIVDLIVEEKYVYDQDKKRSGAGRSNRAIASDYVVDGLDAVGIPKSANIQSDLNNLIGVAEKFLNDLDAQLNPPPPPPQPAPPPSGSGKPQPPP
jgi:hypothetical protein